MSCDCFPFFRRIFPLCDLEKYVVFGDPTRFFAGHFRIVWMKVFENVCRTDQIELVVTEREAGGGTMNYVSPKRMRFFDRD